MIDVFQIRKCLHSDIMDTVGAIDIGPISSKARVEQIIWLGFQPKKQQFIIKKKGFMKTCQHLYGGFGFEQLIEELGIDKSRFKTQIKINGLNHRGVPISHEELIDNLLNPSCMIGWKDDNEESYEGGRDNPEYRRFRRTVLMRDKWCKCCGFHKKLEVHHINGYRNHESLRLDVHNGITLCKYCHRKYHAIYGKTRNVNPITFIDFIREYGVR